MTANDAEGFRLALEALGCDPALVPLPSERVPEPEPAQYEPLSDGEWSAVARHIPEAVSRMRPPSSARRFVDALLRLQLAHLSTRYLPEDQEATRQRFLRWMLSGRVEALAKALAGAGELSEVRQAAIDALSEKARLARTRILGARAARLGSSS